MPYFYYYLIDKIHKVIKWKQIINGKTYLLTCIETNILCEFIILP